MCFDNACGISAFAFENTGSTSISFCSVTVPEIIFFIMLNCIDNITQIW